jgi:hypothetical protein
MSPLSPAAPGEISFRNDAQGDAPGADRFDRPLGRSDGAAELDVPATERAGRPGDHGRDAEKAAVRKIGDTKRNLARAADQIEPTSTELTQARRQQVRALLQFHRDVVEPDDLGQPVVRGEILALSPTPAALARAQSAGFRVRSRETLTGLGLGEVVLSGPRGLGLVEALRRLRALDPQGQYDFNHLYQESGAATPGRASTAPATALVPLPSGGLRVGLVDGGVAATPPTLNAARVVQRGFAAGGPSANAHATAVASLLAGHEGNFRGAAPGAMLFVADVYGTTPAGGSAQAIARALGWMAEQNVPVINISLVGPPNLLLQTAVSAMLARGHLIVAAVGNDGPAAPPLYPAAYPGVVAVTGVDSHRRVLPEAGRGTHVDFAAPGAEMAAAGLDGGFIAVRGTSFAAPLAAGLLARRLVAPDREAAGRALTALGRQALDLGPRGPDPIYGRGLVALELRTAPADVQAHLALRDP